LLPERAGRAHAEDLCLTGRTIDTREARAMGVVDEIADGDPTVSALAWARIHLARHSASSLRLAVSAIRAGLTARLREDLPAVEVIYLKELMASSDAREGLDAFLSKRRPIWKNR
jgi:cyclohexa-1,5-dienecarbonyl-CoA hydratase